MPTTPPTGRFARAMITAVMAIIAMLAFVFSFGNVWTLARRLGVPHPIAPLIAPMVDLSVVGLLIALHHLAAQGADPAQLRPATRLMHLCGLLTLALNTAGPLLAEEYGRAALDTVAPALLLGWGTVGPVLLRHLHAPSTTSAPAAGFRAVAHVGISAPAGSVVRTEAPPAAVPEVHVRPEAPRKRTGRPPAASMDQLIAIARPAVAEHGATVAVVKQALREAQTPVGSARLTQLMKYLKDGEAPIQAALDPERQRTEPADT